MSDEPPKNKFRFNKWTTIMALGMSGLSLMVWIATVILKP